MVNVKGSFSVNLTFPHKKKIEEKTQVRYMKFGN